MLSWHQSSKNLLAQYGSQHLKDSLIHGFPILLLWIHHKSLQKALHAKYKMGVLEKDEHNIVQYDDHFSKLLLRANH